MQLAITWHNMSFFMLFTFVQDKVDIDVTDKNGKTPLMLAKGRKHEKVIAYLQKQLKHRKSLISRIDMWWVAGRGLVNLYPSTTLTYFI